MERRTFLQAGLGVLGTGVTALSGCLGVFDQRSALEPPLLEDRPAAVYYPTHKEGMAMVGMKERKGIAIALTYTYPHRFWLINGDRRQKVSVESKDSVHLMGTVWDPKTKTVLPTSNISATITAGSETVIPSNNLWPMLSQNMGYHFGDNLELPGDSVYTVKLRFQPVTDRLTGRFRDSFGESATVTFQFDFSRAKRDEIGFKRLDGKKGKKDALPPMKGMKTPVSQLPKPEQLPGRTLGKTSSGDAEFVAVALDQLPKGIKPTSKTEQRDSYLALSVRTPYNRYPIPLMSLSATLERSGQSKPVFDDSLTATLDPDLGYHYGAAIPTSQSGDRLTLTVDAPPQVSRHEGYETAFLDMPPATISVS